VAEAQHRALKKRGQLQTEPTPSSAVSFLGTEQNGFVASDLKASYVKEADRYAAVVKSDGKEVWSCEHITHHDGSSAVECANREVARRTGEKHSQKD